MMKKRVLTILIIIYILFLLFYYSIAFFSDYYFIKEIWYLKNILYFIYWIIIPVFLVISSIIKYNINLIKKVLLSILGITSISLCSLLIAIIFPIFTLYALGYTDKNIMFYLDSQDYKEENGKVTLIKSSGMHIVEMCSYNKEHSILLKKNECNRIN